MAKRPRSASTFLKFAHFKLQEARTYERRLLQKSRRDTPPEPPASAERDADGPDFFEQRPDPRPPVETKVIGDESFVEKIVWLAAMRYRVAHLTFGCLQKLWSKPRSPRKQLEVVLLTFIDHLPSSKIADRVETTAENAQVLRSHGLDQIGACLGASLSLLKGASMAEVRCAVDANRLMCYLDNPASDRDLPDHISTCRSARCRCLAIADPSQQGGPDRRECVKYQAQLPKRLAAEDMDESAAEHFAALQMHLVLCEECFAAYREMRFLDELALTTDLPIPKGAIGHPTCLSCIPHYAWIEAESRRGVRKYCVRCG